MKRIYLPILLSLFMAVNVSAQKKNGITFKVEELSKPDNLLPVSNYQNILEGLIKEDNDKLRSYPAPLTPPQFNIVAKSNIPQAMVSRGYHSFYEGMYSAYASHCPFTLSPDMVWILIGQGFSAHVNANVDELRNLFVAGDSKTTLEVTSKTIRLDNPDSPWQEAFDGISKQIASHTGAELTGALTADFSTTTKITRIASQITLMDALKPYFEFVVRYMGCGIPEVTLEGTPQDWERVLTKAQALRKYKLDWWVDELEPVLKQFVAASKGKIDQEFWQGMFKMHSTKVYGARDVIDGWVVKFFPYSKDGIRNNLKELRGFHNLPNEIVKVDLRYIDDEGGGNITETPLELWAGFVGLEQNSQTFGLKPTIGWMIRKKDNDAKLIAKLTTQNTAGYGIELRVNAIPPELFKIGPIKKLILNFTGNITMPDDFAKVKIDELYMNGTITDAGKQRIAKLLPYTQLYFNKDAFGIKVDN